MRRAPSDDAAKTVPEGTAVAGSAGEGDGTAMATERVDVGRRRFGQWLWRVPVLLAAGGAGWGVYEAYRIHFDKQAPADPPTFAPAPDTEVAPLAHFPAPWDAVAFAVAHVPAVAVRVPEPVPGGVTFEGAVGPLHLIGFSRVCTHLHCILDYTSDQELIAFGFNYRTDRPALACGCHLSVFDPLRAGRAVSGPAVRPLPRVRLRVVADDADGADGIVVADGIETAT